MPTTAYSTSEARKQLSELINQVKYQNKQIAIGRHGRVEAYLVPPSLIETKKPVESPEAFHEVIRQERAKKNETVYLLSPDCKNFFKRMAKKYNLSLMVLFGSHAKGKVQPDSDVDIAVIPQKNLTSQKEQDLYVDLVQFLGRDDIDVVNLGRVSDVLIWYEIFMHGKVLFEINPELFSRMAERAWFDYQDFKPYFEMEERLLDKKIANLLAV